ncbi:MAG: hypothetical protein AB8B94_10380 [Hyphomicrobiales bacterium]
MAVLLDYDDLETSQGLNLVLEGYRKSFGGIWEDDDCGMELDCRDLSLRPF